jgi:F-type H+-transporting ATPase subunit b
MEPENPAGHGTGQAHEGEHAVHHDAPLLDFDGTFFIQLALFLLLLAILRGLLFKPWLALRAQREDRIGGEKRRAGELDQKATELLSDYESRITRARQIGNEERLKRRTEAMASERTIVDAARTQAEAAVSAQTASLVKQREEARIRMVAGAQAIGRSIVGKILGREVAS